MSDELFEQAQRRAILEKKADALGCTREVAAKISQLEEKIARLERQIETNRRSVIDAAHAVRTLGDPCPVCGGTEYICADCHDAHHSEEGGAPNIQVRQHGDLTGGVYVPEPPPSRPLGKFLKRGESDVEDA